MVQFLPDAEAAGRHSLEDIQVFTLQGHPEYVEGIVSGLVARRVKTGIIDTETAADSVRRKDWRNDGIEILGKTIWGVLGVVG